MGILITYLGYNHECNNLVYNAHKNVSVRDTWQNVVCSATLGN